MSRSRVCHIVPSQKCMKSTRQIPHLHSSSFLLSSLALFSSPPFHPWVHSARGQSAPLLLLSTWPAMPSIIITASFFRSIPLTTQFVSLRKLAELSFLHLSPSSASVNYGSKVNCNTAGLYYSVIYWMEGHFLHSEIDSLQVQVHVTAGPGWLRPASISNHVFILSKII